MSDIQRWADAAQYRSEPMQATMPGGLVVTLLNATPDPLGSIAALCAMYEGRVIRGLSELTDADRRAAFENMRKTVLNGPESAVQFHFIIEGADRALTHQAVRQSIGTFFAQESLRFAVVDEERWTDRTTRSTWLESQPPGLNRDLMQQMWEDAIETSNNAYTSLVNMGMPAEEARGLMPHAIQTRYHYVTNLKGLLQEAGKRTCTQAQFHWRLLFAGIAKALRDYGYEPGGPNGEPMPTAADAWQFALIAEALRPNCFQTGSCGFMAQFDRGCTIRERVNAFSKAGVPSSEWGRGYAGEGLMEFEGQDAGGIPAIHPAEWAADPGAART